MYLQIQRCQPLARANAIRLTHDATRKSTEVRYGTMLYDRGAIVFMVAMVLRYFIDYCIILSDKKESQGEFSA